MTLHALLLAATVAVDFNSEIGRGNQIPLWLLGFLY